MTDSQTLQHPCEVSIIFERYDNQKSVCVRIDLTGVEFIPLSSGDVSKGFWMLHSDLQMIAVISKQLKSWKTDE